jgi:arylsulfatase A-like enzyme
MVSLVDAQVGRLVECLNKAGLLNNTIIAINSDQGFQLGEHGLWKKRVFYEQNVCVPFIMSCPGLLPPGKVIDEPVEMIDFLPTLMELSGIEVPGSIRGRSLIPLIRGETSEWRPACFSEIDHSYSMYEELRGGTGRRVMVRTKEWKLTYFMDERVADKDGALYNLKKDKDEKENLYNKPQYKDIIRELEGLAEKWDQEK